MRVVVPRCTKPLTDPRQSVILGLPVLGLRHAIWCHLKRRKFIMLLGGALPWPIAARAQRGERVPHVGVLVSTAANDPAVQERYAAFLQSLQQLGWTDGHNVRIDARWAAGNIADMHRYAAELIALAPDVILCEGSPSAGALLQATRTVPIVFTLVADPVGAGFVDSLSRPGGNATGFMLFEYSLAGKWLELLKEIAPRVTRAAILRDSAIAAGAGQFAVIQTAYSRAPRPPTCLCRRRTNTS
jgi:putative tryptophan/tyrosine transport system substrate-binding protein